VKNGVKRNSTQTICNFRMPLHAVFLHQVSSTNCRFCRFLILFLLLCRHWCSGCTSRLCCVQQSYHTATSYYKYKLITTLFVVAAAAAVFGFCLISPFSRDHSSTGWVPRRSPGVRIFADCCCKTVFMGSQICLLHALSNFQAQLQMYSFMFYFLFACFMFCNLYD